MALGAVIVATSGGWLISWNVFEIEVQLDAKLSLSDNCATDLYLSRAAKILTSWIESSIEGSISDWFGSIWGLGNPVQESIRVMAESRRFRRESIAGQHLRVKEICCSERMPLYDITCYKTDCVSRVDICSHDLLRQCYVHLPCTDFAHVPWTILKCLSTFFLSLLCGFVNACKVFVLLCRTMTIPRCTKPSDQLHKELQLPAKAWKPIVSW